MCVCVCVCVCVCACVCVCVCVCVCWAESKGQLHVVPDRRSCVLANVTGPTELLSLSICSNFDVRCCAKVCAGLHCNDLASPQCISTSAEEAATLVLDPSKDLKT